MTPSSLIVMVAINVILIKRRQSACNTNTLSVMRDEAVATSSALKLQGSLANKHDKIIVRML
jgi:hypothetical protein